MIEYLLLLFAIPLGHLFGRLTKDEKNIYTKKRYLPSILLGLLLLTAINLFYSRTLFFTTTFLSILLIVWVKH